MSHPKKVNPNIVLGARVQVDSAQGARGCVRYIGPVHSESEKSGKIWVGVEWDEIGRGKHDGTLDGVRYFSCSPLQGSFVHPARLMMGVTVKTALQSKYNEASIKGPSIDDDDESQYIFKNAKVSIPVLVVGKEKMIEEFKNTERLTKVVLPDCFVSSVGPVEEMGQLCPNLAELDLENNLLHNWEDVASLGDQLPLVELRLSSNFLHHSLPVSAFLHSSRALPLHGLCRLFLNNVPDAWNHIHTLASYGCVPMLEELHLCLNKISIFDAVDTSNPQRPGTSTDLAPITCFANLQLLNVSNNLISDWQQLHRFRALPKLRRIIANYNKLSSLKYVEGYESKELPFASLQWISLTDNLFPDFSALVELSRFPQITELNFTNNPATQHMSVALARAITVAHVPKLKVLQHSEIWRRERLNAEQLYVNLCVQDWHLQAQALRKSQGAQASPANVQSEPNASSLPHDVKQILQRCVHPLSQIIAAHANAALAPPQQQASAGPPAATYDPAPLPILPEDLAALSNVSLPLLPPPFLYDRFKELVELYQLNPTPPSAQTKKTLANSLLSISFYRAPAAFSPSSGIPPLSTNPSIKKIPQSMSVTNIKALTQRLFKVPPLKQVLVYRDDPDDVPQVLDDQLKELSYYGAVDGGQVLVFDAQ